MIFIITLEHVLGATTVFVGLIHLSLFTKPHRGDMILEIERRKAVTIRQRATTRLALMTRVRWPAWSAQSMTCGWTLEVRHEPRWLLIHPSTRSTDCVACLWLADRVLIGMFRWFCAVTSPAMPVGWRLKFEPENIWEADLVELVLMAWSLHWCTFCGWKSRIE